MYHICLSIYNMQTNNIEIILPKCGICTLDRRFFHSRQNLYLQSQLPPSPLPTNARYRKHANTNIIKLLASFYFLSVIWKFLPRKLFKVFFCYGTDISLFSYCLFRLHAISQLMQIYYLHFSDTKTCQWSPMCRITNLYKEDPNFAGNVCEHKPFLCLWGIRTTLNNYERLLNKKCSTA